MMKKSILLSLALLGMLIAGSAQAQVSGNVMIGTPPPVLREEVVPPPPGPGPRWVWHKGHWHWNGVQYIWRAGHWAKRPHRGAVWVEPHYVPNGPGWAYVPGHWQ